MSKTLIGNEIDKAKNECIKELERRVDNLEAAILGYMALLHDLHPPAYQHDIEVFGNKFIDSFPTDSQEYRDFLPPNDNGVSDE